MHIYFKQLVDTSKLHYLEEGVTKLSDVILNVHLKGNTMIHTNKALTKINHGRPKIFYQEYLEHGDEPKFENLYDGASVELDADLIWNSYYQKRKFRRAAKRLKHVS